MPLGWPYRRADKKGATMDAAACVMWEYACHASLKSSCVARASFLCVCVCVSCKDLAGVFQAPLPVRARLNTASLRWHHGCNESAETRWYGAPLNGASSRKPPAESQLRRHSPPQGFRPLVHCAGFWPSLRLEKGRTCLRRLRCASASPQTQDGSAWRDGGACGSKRRRA